MSDCSLSASSITDLAATASRRLKIAHVVLSLAPGGLERLVCELSAATAEAGMDVVVCCLDVDGELARGARARGVRVEIVKRQSGANPGLFLELARFFRRERVDVVHTHGPDPMFYGGWAATLAGVPVRLHTQHDTMLATAGWSERLKFRLAAPAFHNLVAVSEKTREIVADHCTARGRLLTIQNGIDDRKFVPADAGDARLTRTYRIGTVARLAPEKGLDRLVDAFAQLAPAFPSCELMLVGDGPEMTRLVEQVARLGLTGRVTFTGHCDDVEGALRGLDLFVLPSLTEGIPLALLEAMAAGLPVVASAVGGVPEVVESGVSGILVRPDDRELLRQTIAELIDDPARCAALGVAARARVRQRFGLGAMAAAYRELYRQDLSTRWYLAPIKRLVQRLCPRTLVTWRGPQTRSEAALTLDDGPDPVYTPKLLDLLATHNVRGTFFLVGEKVARYPKLVEQIVAAGHEIASHSYSHPQFSELTWAAAVDELTSTRQVLDAAAPASRRLFRPPHGTVALGSTVAPWLQGETVVLWNVDYKDYLAEEATDIVARVGRRGVTNGDIVLYHGHNPAALEALPAILESGRRNGISFVPVSRMVEG